MKRGSTWRRMALLAAALVLAMSACAPTDHPYRTYGAGAHGGGNR